MSGIDKGASTTHDSPSSDVSDKIIPVQLVRMVAAGAQGKVFQARRTDIDKDANIAVKCILLDLDLKSRATQIELLKSKFDIIKKLHHKNLVSHIHNQEIAVSQIHDPPVYQIIMEFCEGQTLHDCVRTFVVTPSLLQKWTKQIVDGLTYLHDNRCVHRDIKGDNILLTSNDPNTCIIKIADLGDVKRLLKEATQTKEVSHERGTWAFMSPEIITGEDKEEELAEKDPKKKSTDEPNKEKERQERMKIGRRTDIWSLACVIIEMLNGTLPEFHNKNGSKISGDMAVMYFVGTGGGPTIPARLPGDVRSFIEKCLQRDPNKRPWGAELKTHPMLTATDVSGWTLPPRTVSAMSSTSAP